MLARPPLKPVYPFLDFLERRNVKSCYALLGLFMLNGFVSCGTAEAEDHPAFQPVKDLFAAMSDHDGDAMRKAATKDFQLLEHGEDWSLQKLVDAVQPRGTPLERKNFFKQIRARQAGDVAWVSYWNKAEIHRGTERRILVWLESAVMVKEDDRWKVQLMHSTRLAPDKNPTDIQWIAHEPKSSP